MTYIHHLYGVFRLLPKLCHYCAIIAQELCGRKLSKNWSSRFVARRQHMLDADGNTLDPARHKADSRASYDGLFLLENQKVNDTR